MYRLPRWVNGNAYPHMMDGLEVPAAQSWVTASTQPDLPTNERLPLSWVLSSATTPASSSMVAQAVFEPLASEGQYAQANLLSLHKRMTLADASDTERAWLVSHSEPVHKLEVQLEDDSWTEISVASGTMELLNGCTWTWLPIEYSALITGLGIQEQWSEKRVADEHWHFVSNQGLWDPTFCTFVQHPSSLSWFPLHASQVRSDGFLNVWADQASAVRLRTYCSTSASALTSVRVRVNDDIVTTATQVDMWNSVDELGLRIGVARREHENNATYLESLLQWSWFSSGTMTGVRDGLCSFLRAGHVSQLTALTSSYTLPSSGSTGYTVLGLPQYAYVQEVLAPDPDNTSVWRTKFAAPTLGQIHFRTRGVEHTVTDAQDGTLTLDSLVDNRYDTPVGNWRLKLWTDTASGFTLTNNVPQAGQVLTVFAAQHVRVAAASDATRRASFKRTSPTYRWAAYARAEATDKETPGLAAFS